MNDALLMAIVKNRKDVSSSEITQELHDNMVSLKELSSLLEHPFSSWIYEDLIYSYRYLPEKVSREQRRNFAFGMNYFHHSEILDQQKSEMPVYDLEDLNILIENRTEDLEYMVEDTYPELIDEYTKKGVETQAKVYHIRHKGIR